MALGVGRSPESPQFCRVLTGSPIKTRITGCWVNRLPAAEALSTGSQEASLLATGHADLFMVIGDGTSVRPRTSRSLDQRIIELNDRSIKPLSSFRQWFGSSDGSTRRFSRPIFSSAAARIFGGVSGRARSVSRSSMALGYSFAAEYARARFNWAIALRSCGPLGALRTPRWCAGSRLRVSFCPVNIRRTRCR